MWHADPQTFGAFRQTGAENTSFHPLTSWRAISVKFEHKTWIGVLMNSFGTNFRHFSEKGYFPRKISFLGFCGYTCGARALALAFTPTANLSNEHCILQLKDRNVCTPSDFFRTTYRFRDIGVKVTPNFGNFAKCRHIFVDSTVYIVGSSDIYFIWQLYDFHLSTWKI